jgi:hypothetical protein
MADARQAVKKAYDWWYSTARHPSVLLEKIYANITEEENKR